MYICTAKVGKNEDLIPDVLSLYAKDGDMIADVTYGKGNFWKQTDLSKYSFFPSDIMTGIDFRDLPYLDETFNIVVLDPPYMHGSKAPINEHLDSTYRNNFRGGYGNDYVLCLYLQGIMECWRVLKDKGYLFVKCQDQVESGKNKYDHIKIYNMALDLGMIAEDLFILVVNKVPMMRHKYQFHARKNHSYLWVFKKKERNKNENRF